MPPGTEAMDGRRQRACDCREATELALLDLTRGGAKRPGWVGAVAEWAANSRPEAADSSGTPTSPSRRDGIIPAERAPPKCRVPAPVADSLCG